MKIGKWSFLASLQLFALMVGCLSEEGDKTTSSFQDLGNTFTEAPLAYQGGSGGTYTGHVTPSGVIYGVNVRAAATVDAIAFAWFQPRSFDNVFTFGDAYGWTQLYGGGGGTDHGWWYCPENKGVIGLRGNAGLLVDRIGVICGDVWAPNPYSPNNTYSPLWGGSGGSWFSEACASNRLVDSFNLRSGVRLDGIQPICIDAY